MSTFKRFALRCFLGFVSVMSVPSALAGAPVKIVCPCTFEQFDQTAARVEFELGFIEQVETSGLLSLEVVHMSSRDFFSSTGYYSLGRASLGNFEFSSDLTTVVAQIPLRARELDEGFLALLLWSDQSAFPLDQVLLGPELVAIDTSYGIYPFDSPSIMFSSGLDFAFGFEGAELTIGEIFSPDLAGTQETWALELVVADS
ncbi:MAG: hypothetical protein VW879_16195, partial [Opitutae bacterium]